MPPDTDEKIQITDKLQHIASVQHLNDQLLKIDSVPNIQQHATMTSKETERRGASTVDQGLTINTNEIRVDEQQRSEMSPYENNFYGQTAAASTSSMALDESASLALKMNFKNVTDFDRKLIRRLVDTDLINKKHVRAAVSTDKKAPKPIFNLQDDADFSAYQSKGGMTFIPSPSRLQSFENSLVRPEWRESIQRQRPRATRSPSGKLFNELIDQAKSLRDALDMSKTAEEIGEQKKLERGLERAYQECSDSRMLTLESQINEYANVARKPGQRRNTYQDIRPQGPKKQVHIGDRRETVKEMLLENDPFKLPDIGGPRKNYSNFQLLPADQLK